MENKAVVKDRCEKMIQKRKKIKATRKNVVIMENGW